MTTTWLSSLCIASIAVSILYKITKFANFSRSQSFSCGSLFCKQTSLQPSAYTDAVCSLLIGHSKRLHLMYVQLVIFHFFLPSPFPAFFLFMRGGGNLNSFGTQEGHPKAFLMKRGVTKYCTSYQFEFSCLLLYFNR